MHLGGWDSWTHPGEGQLLALQDCVVQFANCLRGAATHNGAGDVTEVAGGLRARKNVDDNRLISAQQTVAGLVRVAALPAPGHDRMAGEPVRLNDGNIDYSAQFLRG